MLRGYAEIDDQPWGPTDQTQWSFKKQKARI